MECTQEYNIYELTDMNNYEVKEIMQIEEGLSGYEKTLEIFKSYQKMFEETIFARMVVYRFDYSQIDNFIELGIDDRFLDEIENNECELNIVKSFDHTIKELDEINILRIGSLL